MRILRTSSHTIHEMDKANKVGPSQLGLPSPLHGSKSKKLAWLAQSTKGSGLPLSAQALKEPSIEKQ